MVQLQKWYPRVSTLGIMCRAVRSPQILVHIGDPSETAQKIQEISRRQYESPHWKPESLRRFAMDCKKTHKGCVLDFGCVPPPKSNIDTKNDGV